MKSNDQLAHAGEEDHVRLVRDVPRAVDFTEPHVLGLGTVRHDLEDGASPVEADHATGVLKGRHGIAHFARGMLDALRDESRRVHDGAVPVKDKKIVLGCKARHVSGLPSHQEPLEAQHSPQASAPECRAARPSRDA